MTPQDIPDPIEKRDRIYGDDTSPDELEELGNQFLKHEYFSDALDAYIEGDIEEGGRKVLEKATELGNYFLINRIHQQWPDLVDQDTWQDAGQTAEEQGRLTDAVKLYYAGDFTDDLQRAEEQLEDELGHAVPAVVKSDTADAKEKDQLDE